MQDRRVIYKDTNDQQVAESHLTSGLGRQIQQRVKRRATHLIERQHRE